MSDISDFSETEDFSEGEKKTEALTKKSKNINVSKKRIEENLESMSKNNSLISIDIVNENEKLNAQTSGTYKRSLQTQKGSEDDNVLNIKESKTFKHSFSNSKLKGVKHNTSVNAKVADCVMSPPEFFLSHIYHDNKVFTKTYGHSMVEYENEFFIYGGINSKNEYLDEFLTFTYGTNTFTSKKLSVNPGKRAYASMTLTYNINNNSPSLLLFGGLCGPNILAKDCYMYDFMEDMWSKYTFKLDSSPGTRYGHAYTYCPNSYATIIWGGVNRNNELLNSGHKFNNGEWSELKHKGICPSGRVYSTIVWLDRTTKENIHYSFLYLFGGDLTNKGSPTDELWVYNFKKENWFLMKNSSGEAPCPRWKHGAVIFDKNMWISGGLCSGWFSNYSIPDLYVYDIPSNCWFNCQIASKQIHNCYDYGTLNLHSQTKAFFLFGGKNANNDPTSNVCRFAPLCTNVSIMTMRNEIKRFSNYVLDVKNESEDTANNVSEMQKIIHTFSLDIKDFKILFEALTKSIQLLNDNIENINKEIELLKKKISTEDEAEKKSNVINNMPNPNDKTEEFVNEVKEPQINMENK
ncbi:hypothetical protein PFAG_03768 [Plasmodium falciparum Santa Lucia]|uniref:Kelch domain-containing protein n=13 Tax=Plasmodium falciparum TaxID=5833 RepID=W4J3H0_PLAFP|nr:hypothetical protein PFFVO_03389 [Plasmodium falciparum Vietnam Oak-Knoll (FVO)]ETW30133.1 hypothetical protein PFFCH_02444 [Plasmodium falciparum FCH/4]ETW35528.1 hypothetical protein PFTANZ_03767 [Plasmodium falciparum Tanzania (2000708)]ETW41784.1 hypothetical protein PFNF135_03936 [Plasmodium falciparum NF135/5.C10]ETW48277.1 hypothetical protein PFMALIP_03676 [Plasmodium falciparum MaliPS096_E11]ETW56171.1 hypothetical protein PFUGPA_01832 [Plasmodium falciparum Palo Alto/Uganda]ETW60